MLLGIGVSLIGMTNVDVVVAFTIATSSSVPHRDPLSVGFDSVAVTATVMVISSSNPSAGRTSSVSRALSMSATLPVNVIVCVTLSTTIVTPLESPKPITVPLPPLGTEYDMTTAEYVSDPSTSFRDTFTGYVTNVEFWSTLGLVPAPTSTVGLSATACTCT